jgi:hypothetical protein
MTETKQAMTLEKVRDWMRRLEKQHELVPPLREAYGSAADAIDAHLAEQPRNDLCLGVMRCAKCKLQLIRTNLYVANGTTGPGDNKTEPCPNGCGPLWPVTWKEYAQKLEETVDKLWDELQASKDAQREGVPVAEVVDLQACFPSCAVVPPMPVGTKLYIAPPHPRVEVTDEMVDRAMTAYDEFLGMDDEADYEAMRSAIQAAINGNAFFDSNIEERMLEDAKNACHHCGGSGHKDDAKPRAEPYAYIYEYDTYAGVHREFSPREWNGLKPVRTVPVYTAQPSPLVELTKELVDAAIEIACRFKNDEIESVDDLDAPMRAALEAALSEKGL